MIFRIANRNGLKIKIDNQKGNLQIESSSDSVREIKGKISLPKSEQIKFENAINGKSIENFEIDGAWILELGEFQNQFRIRIIEDLQKLIISKKPSIIGPIDIKFADGNIYRNIDFELFGYNPKANIYILKITTTDFSIEIKVKFDINNDSKINILIEPKNLFKNTSSVLEFYKIYNKIMNKENFELIKNENVLFNYTIDYDLIKKESMVLNEYFIKLHKIENHYSVLFKNIKIEEINEEAIKKIIAYIEKQTIIRYNPKIMIPKDKIINLDILNQKDPVSYQFVEKENLKVELHDLKFDIGKPQYNITDTIILNKIDLKSKNVSTIEFGSKSNIVYVKYLESN